jgi:hypothetical protein
MFSYFAPLDTTVNTRTIQDLEKEIEVLKTKGEAYEGILEVLRQQVLRISHRLKILDPTYQGEQYEYSLQ